jgi:hypothetical protein
MSKQSCNKLDSEAFKNFVGDWFFADMESDNI